MPHAFPGGTVRTGHTQEMLFRSEFTLKLRPACLSLKYHKQKSPEPPHGSFVPKK